MRSRLRWHDLRRHRSSEQTQDAQIGDVAKDFEFQPLEGNKKLKLSALAKDGPVVLVVLRGFPGYQCPVCSQQVRDLREHAKQFAELGDQDRARLSGAGRGPQEAGPRVLEGRCACRSR